MVYAALLPALVLMIYIYAKDKREKEPLGLIVKIVFLGVVSSFLAMFLEEVAGFFLPEFFQEGTTTYILVEAFIGIALMEEYSKYLAVRLGAWNSKHFNYTFDAVVYSVAAALGFAGFENILYVMESGMETAIMRAITAVPGHAINGVTMGLFLGKARAHANMGNKKKARRYKRLALLMPTIEHGIYDAALEFDADIIMLVWILFVVGVDLWAFFAIRKASKNDQQIA